LSVAHELNQIIATCFQVDTDTITRDTTADQVPGWDSISHIRLVLEVEKAFKIRFRTQEIGKMRNVGDLADLVSEKTGR
jgi:acyl carrier protein